MRSARQVATDRRHTFGAAATGRAMRSNQNNSVSVCNRVTMPLTSPGVESAARAITKRRRRLDSSMAVRKLDSWGHLGEQGTPGGQTPEPARCYLSRMPREIDVVGVWHGTPYQVASLSSTANGVIVACGPTGRHTTYPKTGHRHIKAPSSGTSTWYERQVLSDVTLAQPLQVIAFSAAKPPVWAKPHATRPSHDSFTWCRRTARYASPSWECGKRTTRSSS